MALTLGSGLRQISQVILKSGPTPATWLRLVFENGPLENFAEEAHEMEVLADDEDAGAAGSTKAPEYLTGYSRQHGAVWRSLVIEGKATPKEFTNNIFEQERDSEVSPATTRWLDGYTREIDALPVGMLRKLHPIAKKEEPTQNEEEAPTQKELSKRKVIFKRPASGGTFVTRRGWPSRSSRQRTNTRCLSLRSTVSGRYSCDRMHSARTPRRPSP